MIRNSDDQMIGRSNTSGREFREGVGSLPMVAFAAFPFSDLLIF
jgi:hypothetical protein